MIYTIHAKTKAVSFDLHNPDHIPMARNQFGDATYGYIRGWLKPNHPMPVTAATAALSVYHQDHWPNTIWPYMMVKDELKYLT